MSLILEALKKSEQQRRLGEAPTFGSPVVTTRRRRNFLPVLAILIVIAAGAGWWLSRRADQPPPAAPVAAEATTPAAQSPLAGQVQVRPPASPAAGNRTAPRSIPKADPDNKRPGVLGNATHATPTPAPSTATKPAATDAAVMPAPDKSAGLRAPAPPVAAPPKTDASVPASAPQKSDGAAAAAPKSETAESAPAADSKGAPAASADKTAAAGSALPTIWELPYSVRKDLPAIDLSMHVYSADPKQRFVVLKGDRHTEGDEVGQDLVLKEIRQDGVVLDYKGQRFFFPRTGR